MNSNEFHGKTALVTGASEGIGRATAIEFAKHGANLIIVARNKSRLESLKSELVPLGVDVQQFDMDLSVPGAVQKLFTKIKTLDFAVNNAGTEGKIAEIQDLETEDFDHVFNLNVKSVFECMKYEIQHFRNANKPGAIVNVSSIAGMMGFAKSGLYVSSKHAVIGLTKSAALEQIPHGIRINSICPGATDTPMMRRIIGEPAEKFDVKSPQSKLSEPIDVALPILWLCGGNSKNVVGHSLVVNGNP